MPSSGSTIRKRGSFTCIRRWQTSPECSHLSTTFTDIRKAAANRVSIQTMRSVSFVTSQADSMASIRSWSSDRHRRNTSSSHSCTKHTRSSYQKLWEWRQRTTRPVRKSSLTPESISKPATEWAVLAQSADSWWVPPRVMHGKAWPHCSRQEKTMTIIDRVVEANRIYARTYSPQLGKRPEPKIAVVTCMDPRLSDLPGILGLPEADIDMIRTGGPAVTQDVLAELIVSNRVLGTTEILLLNHTGCGFTTFTDDELNGRLSASTGDASPAPMRFFSFRDPEQNTLEQIEAVRSHPWIAKDVPVRGFIFDVETGLLKEVQPVASHTAVQVPALASRV